MHNFLSSVLVVMPLNAIINEKCIMYGRRGSQVGPTGNCDVSSKPTYMIGHPEFVLQSTFLKELKSSVFQDRVTHIIVDEAHCVVTWGESFRPDYRGLDCLRAILPEAKIIAMTATATLQTQRSISSHLRFCAGYATIHASCDRPNIFYRVSERPSHNSTHRTTEQAYDEILEPILSELKEKGNYFPKTILFSKLKWCGYGHEVALRLMADDQLHCYDTNDQYTSRLGQYHSPQVDGLKQELSRLFKDKNSHVRLLLATEAYSMGADAPDIRRIIHIGPPSTLETYVQETGRAGRDSKPAEAIIFVNRSDLGANVKHLTNDMKQFCTTSGCRRLVLNQHFDSDHIPPKPAHLCCDNCAKRCQCDDCDLLRAYDQFSPSSSSFKHSSPISKQGVDTVKNLLIQYFDAENSAVTIPCPMIQTGLDSNLLNTVAADYVKFSDINVFKSSYPYLDDFYMHNIVNILKFVTEMLQ